MRKSPIRSNRLRHTMPLFVALAVVAAGCGNSDNDAADPVDSAAPETSATADEPATDDAPADSTETTDVATDVTPPEREGACASTNGVSDDAINLGAFSDLSGPVAAGGVPFAHGVQAYVEYANNELDGVNGRQLTLELADHQYNPELALSEYRDMSDDILAIPLSMGAPTTSAISGSLEQDCLATVAGSFAAEDAALPNIFIGGATYEAGTINLLDYFINEQGNEGARIAALYQGDVFGEGALAALEFAAEVYDFEIVERQSYAPGDSDYSGQLEKIRASEPDVVFMASTVGGTFGFFGAAEASGAEWDYIALQPAFAPGVFGLPFSAAFQEKMTIGYNSPVWSQEGEGNAVAIEQIATQFPDSDGDGAALIGWIAAEITYQALVAADNAGDLTRGGVIDAMEALSFETNGVGPVELAFNGGAVPTTQSVIVSVDESIPGGLKIVKDWFTADAVVDYAPATGS